MDSFGIIERPFFVGALRKRIASTLYDLHRYREGHDRDDHHIGLVAIIAETDRQITDSVTSGNGWLCRR